MHAKADIEIDLSGLTCPLPLLKAKQALNGLDVGKIVKIIATDPGSERDFHTFAQQSNTLLLEFQKVDDHYHYWLQKG